MTIQARIRYARVKQIAEYLEIHPEKVRVMARAGAFPNAIMLGRGAAIRVPWTDVEDFRRKQPVDDATVRQVAEALSLHPETVRKLVRGGSFPKAFRIGLGRPSSPIRIPWSDVEDFRKQQPKACR